MSLATGSMRSDTRRLLPDLIEMSAEIQDRGFTFIDERGQERYYSFRELHRAVVERAELLRTFGVTKSDRVGLLIPDPEEFVKTFFAALIEGIVPIPLAAPMNLGTLESYLINIFNTLRIAGAETVFTISALSRVVSPAVEATGASLNLYCVDDTSKIVVSTRGQTGQYSRPLVSGEDLAFLQFTSGSTANPRGVMVTHDNLLANYHATASRALCLRPEEDIFVSWLPMFHDMGIGTTISPLYGGFCSGVYFPSTAFLKRPWSWFERISEHRGTITFAPNFAYALATYRTPRHVIEKLDLSSLRIIGCGAEPINPNTIRAFLDHFSVGKINPRAFYSCYGMAESTVGVTFSDLGSGLVTDVVDAELYRTQNVAKAPADEAATSGVSQTVEFVSCGRILHGLSIKIVDDTGKELPERAIGEVVVSGSSVSPGYYSEARLTKEVFHHDGLWTGDLGYIAEGLLFITGRKKDLVIINGKNYDPQSFEWLVSEVDGVRKGCVVAFSVHGDSTEELVVVAERSDQSDPSSIRSTIKKVIHEHFLLRVREVVIVSEKTIKKTSSGKLKRSALHRQYVDGELEGL
jgi:fatty-acyl-CoA synthase